jgi:hypothetical protein
MVGGEVAELFVAEAAFGAVKTPEAFDHWALREAEEDPA